jgi:hypothetical protein
MTWTRSCFPRLPNEEEKVASGRRSRSAQTRVARALRTHDSVPRSAHALASKLSPCPSIIISDSQLRDVSEEAVKALVASNSIPVVFQGGGALVRIRHYHPGPAIEEMSDAALRGRLARVADWYRMTMAGRVVTGPPAAVVRDIPGLARDRRATAAEGNRRGSAGEQNGPPPQRRGR